MQSLLWTLINFILTVDLNDPRLDRASLDWIRDIRSFISVLYTQTYDIIIIQIKSLLRGEEAIPPPSTKELVYHLTNIESSS